MKNAVPIVLIAFLSMTCSPPAPPVEFHSSDFNWTITLPEGFDSVKTEDWQKMQSRGQEAMEDTMGEEIENYTTTLFVVRSGLTNYMEANHQPFDEAVDGDYLASRKAVDQILYQTFAAQMPGSKVDSLTSVERVDNLDFYKTEMKVTYPNDIVMNVLMYGRLFEKKDFTLSIMYTDDEKGKKMKDAWLASTFSSNSSQ